MTIENSTNDKAVGPMEMLSVFDNIVKISMPRDSLLTQQLVIPSNSFVTHITGDNSCWHHWILDQKIQLVGIDGGDDGGWLNYQPQ